MKIFDAIQHDSPEVQTAAVACSMLLICRKHGLHPGDIMETATRILNEKAKRKTDLGAVEMYINKEL